MSINNNTRFCYWNRWKVLSSNIFEECKYAQEKIKFENYINEELDSDSNDEEGSNIDNDNDDK